MVGPEAKRDSRPAHADLPLDQVIEGEAVAVLNGLPEKSVDLIFADPPYNLQLQQELWRPNLTRVDAVDDEWDQFGSFAEYDAFTRDWLNACRRVLKNTGTLWVISSYHSLYRIGAILMDLGYWILNEVVWEKANPTPNFKGTRFTNAHETLIWAQKIRGQKYTFNYWTMKGLNDDKQMRSDWLIPICSGAERIKVDGAKAHSTQKPEALLYRVIASSSNPGDVLLDPFFGSGTTGAVAKKLHRRWIGIERDPAYVAVARQRLAAITPPPYSPDVFDPEAQRRQPKIPFGMVLEAGFIQPGQTLYFSRNGERATVLANGHVKWGDLTGSIHAVASAIVGTRCNGWEHWFADDAESGERVVIDHYRAMIRNINKGAAPK